MTKVQILKLLGFLAAALTGGVMIATGDVINGVGIIAASLSSATVGAAKDS